MRKMDDKAAILLIVLMMSVFCVLINMNIYTSVWQAGICFAKLIAIILGELLCIWIYKCFVSDYLMVKMKKIMLGMNIASLFLVIAIIAEQRLSEISITDQNKICIGFIEIHKKWIFDVWVIILFPTIVMILEKAVVKVNSNKNKFAAVSVVVLVSLFGFLIFHKLGNAWLVNMALLNVVTVLSFVLYMHHNCMEEIGKCLCMSILYALFWIFLLLLNRRVGQSFTGYKIIGLFDTSRIISLHESWQGKFLYLIILIIFIAGLYHFLESRYCKYKTFYPIYLSAFSRIVLRTIFDFTYSCGLIDSTVSTPFVGNVGLVMDSVCLALLIYSEYENRKLVRTMSMVKTMCFKKVSECFKAPNKDGEYNVNNLLYDMESKMKVSDILFMNGNIWTIMNGKEEIIQLYYLQTIRINDRKYKIYMLVDSEMLIAMEIKVTYVDDIKRKQYIAVEDEELFIILLEYAKKHLVRRCLKSIGEEDTKQNVKEFLDKDFGQNVYH